MLAPTLVILRNLVGSSTLLFFAPCTVFQPPSSTRGTPEGDKQNPLSSSRCSAGRALLSSVCPTDRTQPACLPVFSQKALTQKLSLLSRAAFGRDGSWLDSSAFLRMPHVHELTEGAGEMPSLTRASLTPHIPAALGWSDTEPLRHSQVPHLLLASLLG